ncbi:unnamed protein product, partial [Urochloa humidicola]
DQPSWSSARRRIYRRPRAEGGGGRRRSGKTGRGGPGSESAMGDSSGSGSVSVDIERISFGGKEHVV